MKDKAGKTKTAAVSVMLFWEVIVDILDWIGRLDVIRDLLPDQLHFLITGWFRAILLGLIFLLLLYRKIRESDVLVRVYGKFGIRHPMISSAVAICIGAIIGGLFGGVIWWRSSRQYAAFISRQAAPKPPLSWADRSVNSHTPTAAEIAEELAKRFPKTPEVPKAELPLAIEFHVASPKIVTVLNHGREIQDVRLRLTEYGYKTEGPWTDSPATKDKPAIIHKPPNRVAFYQLQGYFMDVPSIPANTKSTSLDLWAIKSLGFFEPGSSPPPSAIPRDSFGFYALRFTFRDPITGKRYAYTRVITLGKYGWPPDDPENTINYSSTGTLPHHVFEDMVKDMNEHQKQLYSNSGEEEYKP